MPPSTTYQATAATVSQPLGGESLPETNVPGIWSQVHITCCPPEVLSHIFGYLSCDDIAQVHDTCIRFREVVRAEHPDAFFYSQLPSFFREQYQQSRSWQKRLVRNGQHPFAAALRCNRNRFFNPEQHAALLCFHALRKMMSIPVYRPVRVFTNRPSIFALRVECRLSSGDLLLHNLMSDQAIMLSPDEAGSWSEEIVDLDESGRRLLRIVTPNGDGGRYSTFGFHNAIEYLKRDADHGRWRLINQQWVGHSDKHVISLSGRYVASYTYAEGIKDIRFLDDQAQWVLMPIAEGARIGSGITLLRFSPSGQHFAIRYKKKLAVISQDSQGCWNLTWTTPWQKSISYMEFCPSDRWLLAGLCEYTLKTRSTADMIRLNPAGKWISQQKIVGENSRLNFSPAGNYLVTCMKGREARLIWRLLKSGEWALDDNLVDPESGPLSVTDPKIDNIQFSPCDNYLLISSKDGAVKIWGQNEQRHWVVLGREQHDGALESVQFSPSGVHALTVDRTSIRIWGRDEGELWRVKGSIKVPGVWKAHFHPVAEHLIIFRTNEGFQVWEVREDDDDSSGEADGST